MLTVYMTNHSQVLCNICGFTGETFETCPEGAVKCPRCRSVSRHRAVWYILEALLANRDSLHLLEGGGDGRFLQSRKITMVAVDASYHKVGVVAQMENLPFGADSFHVGISLDMLEHAKDDGKVVSELARVVRPGGVTLVTASCWGHFGASCSPAEAGLPEYHIGLGGKWDCRCYRYYTYKSLLRLCCQFDRVCGLVITNHSLGVVGQYIVIGGGSRTSIATESLLDEALAAVRKGFACSIL